MKLLCYTVFEVYMKEIKVVAGIIENNGKILCMQRDKGKYDYVSFKWEFPGGKIEEGETNEQALKRELLEEMDLEVDVENHFCDVQYTYPDFKITMFCYKCNTKDLDFKLNVHKDYKWLKKSELNIIDWAPADVPIVKKLMEEK